MLSPPGQQTQPPVQQLQPQVQQTQQVGQPLQRNSDDHIVFMVSDQSRSSQTPSLTPM